MNARIRIILSAGACIAASALALGAASAASAAENPAAAVDNQVMGPPPSPAHVWMSGHWNSEGGQWRWVAGHWDLPPAQNAVWVPGHWIQGSGGWVWVNGAWNVAETPQSPSAPPQPPGAPGQNPNVAPAQGGQAVPMPSAPAPYVAEQYGPNGQVPTIYQAPTETYYPPIDYSATYPGYYWDGAAWAWGVYPAFGIGLGWWGPGYWGWGRGGWGYGHGGRGYGHGYGASHRGSFVGHGGAGHLGGLHIR